MPYFEGSLVWTIIRVTGLLKQTKEEERKWMVQTWIPLPTSFSLFYLSQCSSPANSGVKERGNLKCNHLVLLFLPLSKYDTFCYLPFQSAWPNDRNLTRFWAHVLLCRSTTRQTSGWWRTWILWMTMWLHCSTCPATSLSQSSGRTVSWRTTVQLTRTAESPNEAVIFFWHFIEFSFSFYCLLRIRWPLSWPLSNLTCFLPLYPLCTSLLPSRYVSFHLVSEVKNCQRGYFYHRFPILHSDSGDDFFSFLAPAPRCLSDLAYFPRVLSYVIKLYLDPNTSTPLP